MRRFREGDRVRGAFCGESRWFVEGLQVFVRRFDGPPGVIISDFFGAVWPGC